MPSVLGTTSSTGKLLAAGIALGVMWAGSTDNRTVRFVDGSNTSAGTLRMTVVTPDQAVYMPLGGMPFYDGTFVQSTGAYGGISLLMQ
jgi:hypothetical protein